jgi:2,5-diamino-6-(ribosylamino)-4(3H)-pyrimidinone 5'-phosphate reductase
LTLTCVSLVRHLPQPTESTLYKLPRPVIIDTHLRLPTSCKLLRNFQNGTGRRPWIICTDDSEGTKDGKITLAERKKALEEAGARIIEIPPSSIRDDSSYLSLPAILRSLSDLGIQSLMVEGGARIIGSFFASPEKIVDTLVITVAPVLVGSNGVGYQCKYSVFELDSKKPAGFKEVHTELIGRDMVVAFVYNEV